MGARRANSQLIIGGKAGVRHFGLIFALHSRPQGSQTSLAQLNRIALAFLGGINDAGGNDFVNDCRLALVVKFYASTVERLAHDLCREVVKDGS
jgi:hypothetical protein